MSELRAHFPERDAYLDRLAQHYADGLLDDAGFEARRDMLLRATTHGEMLRAFDGLPQPRYRDGGRRPGVGRRGLLIAGLGVAAVVAAGGIAAGVYGARTPMMSGPMTEEAWQEPVPVAPQPEPIDVGALEETFFTLQERGLTLVGEFAVDITGVSGTAMSPSAPGQLREFSKKTARPLVVAEATPGEVPPTVDLEALHAAVLEGMSRAPMDLGGDGYADRMELVFTQLGTPTVKVTVLTNDPASAAELGTAQYDMDGNLMALEENR